jgi:TonB family protein
MKRWWWRGVMLGALVGPVFSGSMAHAEGAFAAAKRAEASMLATGRIVVATDGSVHDFTLDHAEQLPAPVVRLIGSNVPRWRFQPVLKDGQPVMAQATMNLRVVATPRGGKDYTLAIRGVHFGTDGEAFGRERIKTVPPRYPPAAIRARVSGDVYLVLKIDPAGKVEDVMAEQVNLGIAGTDRQMREMRSMLAKSAIGAAREWIFKPLAPGAAPVDRYVRAPVSYRLHPFGEPVRSGVGQWHVYIPGPHEAVPWFDHTNMLTDSADALPDDGLYLVGPDRGLHLLNAPGGV